MLAWVCAASLIKPCSQELSSLQHLPLVLPSALHTFNSTPFLFAISGGIYGYPGDSKNKNGKLRLLYE